MPTNSTKILDDIVCELALKFLLDTPTRNPVQGIITALRTHDYIGVRINSYKLLIELWSEQSSHCKADSIMLQVMRKRLNTLIMECPQYAT